MAPMSIPGERRHAVRTEKAHSLGQRFPPCEDGAHLVDAEIIRGVSIAVGLDDVGVGKFAGGGQGARIAAVDLQRIG